MSKRPPGLDELLDYVSSRVEEAARASGSRFRGNHIGRSWDSTRLEDECPCPKAACGLVIQDAIDPDCPEHPPQRCKSIRQSHPSECCPATLTTVSLTDPDEPTHCGKCKTAFDPNDTRFIGSRARYGTTPWCHECVSLCHDTEIADHRCVICQ